MEHKAADPTDSRPRDNHTEIEKQKQTKSKRKISRLRDNGNC